MTEGELGVVSERAYTTLGLSGIALRGGHGVWVFSLMLVIFAPNENRSQPRSRPGGRFSLAPRVLWLARNASFCAVLEKPSLLTSPPMMLPLRSRDADTYFALPGVMFS
jgi:hypothetical protein